MMSGQTIARIEKLENGYVVEVCDPKIMENNRKSSSKYEDPWKGHALATVEDVKNFLGSHLDKLSPPPSADEEYKNAFKAASKK